MTHHIHITAKPLDLHEILSHALKHNQGEMGALTHFIGIARTQGQKGQKLQSLTLDHYDGMSEQSLSGIAQEAQKKYALHYVSIHHRIGRINIGETIVSVITCAPHRAASLKSAAELMEWLKSQAPFWKYEKGETEGAWVIAS